MGCRVVVSVIVFGFLCGCGNDTSTGSIQSIGAENFEKMMEECLIEAGITDNPLENVSLKFDNDPAYREIFETCTRDIAPNDADMLLSVHMESLRALPEQDNARLLEAMSCVEEENGPIFDSAIVYREDQFIDFDAVLRSFPTDIEALEYWGYLEECGWDPAPDVDPANFVLERECLVHEHDGESLHAHGDC